jgi:mitogen-activated protein kinase kinase kinase
MSYMTELRSKRDRSDTASLMTVDEITAEVESRRESMAIDRGSDTDDWTKVDSEEGIESETMESTLNEAEEEDYEEELDEETTLNDEDDEEPGKAVTSKGGEHDDIVSILR